MDTIVSIKNLSKSFKSGKKINNVLKNISLDIKKGKVIGYIGPNGAGKSTTVKILCGILEGYKGEIEIFGEPVKADSLEIKRRIGYIPENGALYDTLTPIEFLSFIATIHDIPTEEALKKISSFLEFFDMASHAHQRINTFSKGMKQKILIISGLLHSPELIFMDEPLSGLDANSVILVKELINRLVWEGKTVFYCSHLMDVVEKMSDEIVMINDGEIIAQGECKDLFEQEGVDSLESLFSKLTGNTQQKERASKFVESYK
ncbi:MAG: ABC transporter ATP-binding protein [Marinifilaceae bacterium]